MIIELEKEETIWRKKACHLPKKLSTCQKTWGDGAGYDILSYDVDGAEIYIEVKTTLKDKNAGFIITDNELKSCEKK